MTRRVAGLLLAAGASTRLGRPKALVTLGGTTLAERGVALLRDADCSPVVVVCGAVPLDVAGASVVANAEWATGVGSSLRVGLAALDASDAEAVVIALMDQPRVTAEAVRRLRRAHEAGAAAVVAAYGGVGRNPVLLARGTWEEVARLAQGDVGARAFLHAHPDLVTLVECGDVAAPDDVDTPADLARVASGAVAASVPRRGGARMRAPQRVPLPGLPERVTVYEVGPRDGLQNEPTVVPVEVKAEFITRLVDAGLRVVEATSFVHPRWVPQLADAEQLLDVLTPVEGVRFPVLVPNEPGLARALDRGVREIAVFGSATEAFARRNLNRSIDESIQMFAPVVAVARENDVAVRAYVSMCFGDPWEGHVPIPQVVDVATRMLRLGCTELSLGDTIGVATPGHVTALLDALVQAGVPAARIAVHFHDTYGQALSNALAALRYGVRTLDASAGGLGGCPYAQSATGNLATEDLVWQLHGLGIETGVDLDALVTTSVWMAAQLGRPSPSRVVQALGKDLES